MKRGRPKGDTRPNHMKRTTLYVSLPVWMKERLKADCFDASAYIRELILKDTKWKPEKEES